MATRREIHRSRQTFFYTVQAAAVLGHFFFSRTIGHVPVVPLMIASRTHREASSSWETNRRRLPAGPLRN